jgi:ssDNA-binding Zn-finger/Zn-ribbon topoisomerase 1
MSHEKFIWFNSAEEALTNKYRPCKICCPERAFTLLKIGRTGHLPPYRDYLISITGTGVYHRPDCHHVKDTSSKNKKLHNSALDAFNKGNKPCQECKPDLPEFFCPRCGAPVVSREGRYGKFYGCSKYPLDRFIISWESAAEKLSSGELAIIKLPKLTQTRQMKEEPRQPELPTPSGQKSLPWGFVDYLTRTTILNMVKKYWKRMLIIFYIAVIVTVCILVAVAVRYEVPVVGVRYEVETVSRYDGGEQEVLKGYEVKDYSKVPPWVEIFSDYHNPEYWLVGSIFVPIIAVYVVGFITHCITRRE